MNRLSGLLLLGSLVVAGGCGSGDPPLTPVEGVVKINGQPAANLLVQFTPLADQKKGTIITSSGVSDASGKFVLKGSNGQPGALPGAHGVTVVDNALGDDEPDPMTGKRTMVKNRVPLLYNSVMKSPINITVETGKKDYEVLVTTR